eukprot:CAMPEP_0182836326 /NCGR_PEP_ID=MMETSP0006_2-20121128/22032_1 /TAXON_ID=97485 /ORGANISM="Prymnesium parvum, Strain Texoma1" /LENGTH=159 /DNA_ID=CAMNT_0024964919 /DNA_START=1 /DNA_END=481 /DNA_ORIENTATION=-
MVQLEAVINCPGVALLDKEGKIRRCVSDRLQTALIRHQLRHVHGATLEPLVLSITTMASCAVSRVARNTAAAIASSAFVDWVVAAHNQIAIATVAMIAVLAMQQPGTERTTGQLADHMQSVDDERRCLGRLHDSGVGLHKWRKKLMRNVVLLGSSGIYA